MRGAAADRLDSRMRVFAGYFAPLLAWVTVIGWLSLAPPDQVPQFEFNRADLIEHFAGYLLLGALLVRGWARGGATGAGAAAGLAGLAILWGLYLEILQQLSGYRTFDGLDLLANSSGAVAGVLLWNGYAARRDRRRERKNLH